MLFDDPVFEQWGMRALLHAPFGGAEFGECQATAARITPGDTDSWKTEWLRTADTVLATADTAAAAGRAVSASDAYLRASNYLRTATPFLYGRPVSDELRTLAARSDAAFARAMELGPYPSAAVEIPYEGTSLPGVLIRSTEPGPRPLLIAVNGYDGLIGELWFAYGQAAVRRGYHALLFDGPGQGAALLQRGLALRADWENVVGPVVDFALEQEGVDPARIAVMGWSLGGYLAPRAATGEPRLAAVVADPGLLGMGDVVVGMATSFGLSADQAANLAHLDDATLAPIIAALDTPPLRWSFEQRGLMVHGVDTVAELLRALPAYTLTGRIADIRCPVLVTEAEGDVLATTARSLHEQLTGPKRLVSFTAAEGASGHCEPAARHRYHQITFDWLDEVLG